MIGSISGVVEELEGVVLELVGRIGQLTAWGVLDLTHLHLKKVSEIVRLGVAGPVVPMVAVVADVAV